jgi:hypothetical protein
MSLGTSWGHLKVKNQFLGIFSMYQQYSGPHNFCNLRTFGMKFWGNIPFIVNKRPAKGHFPTLYGSKVMNFGILPQGAAKNGSTMVPVGAHFYTRNFLYLQTHAKH